MPDLRIDPALALLELDSIAAGIAAGDAMAKRAPIDVLRAGTVHPGKFLVLVGGSVGDVEEALAAGREVGAASVRDIVFLPDAHPELVAAIGGTCREAAGEALGVIETATVAAILEAADAGLKGARVRLVELRLADDLGGKGYLLFDGSVTTFLEDRDMLEAQQKNLDGGVIDGLVDINADTAQLQARRILADMMRAERA